MSGRVPVHRRYQRPNTHGAWPAHVLAPESFSGWGVRTLAASESRYNPDGLSHRLGMAARQRLDRSGIGPLRSGGQGITNLDGPVRGRAAFSTCTACPNCSCSSFPQDPEGSVPSPVACALYRPGRPASVFLLFARLAWASANQWCGGSNPFHAASTTPSFPRRRAADPQFGSSRGRRSICCSSVMRMM